MNLKVTEPGIKIDMLSEEAVCEDNLSAGNKSRLGLTRQ